MVGGALSGAVAVIEGAEVDLAPLLQAVGRRATRLPDVSLPPPRPLVLAPEGANLSHSLLALESEIDNVHFTQLRLSRSKYRFAVCDEDGCNNP